MVCVTGQVTRTWRPGPLTAAAGRGGPPWVGRPRLATLQGTGRTARSTSRSTLGRCG